MSSDKESDIVIASRIIAEAIENLSTSVDTIFICSVFNISCQLAKE